VDYNHTELVSNEYDTFKLGDISEAIKPLKGEEISADKKIHI